MSETINIKRVGSAEAISKDNDSLWIRIRLSATPDQDWIHCFRDPSSYQTNEAHPSNARFNTDNTIDFQSTVNGLENNIKWMDKYLEQANTAYNAKKAKVLADKKRKEDLEAKKIEDLKKINEFIKDL